MSRAALALLITTGTILGAPGIATGAQAATPATTVAAFYDWYLAHDGQVSKILPQARGFFDDDLYNGLDDAYFKGGEYTGEMVVSLCAHGAAPPSSGCKSVGYDPFTNDSSPATSYKIGATHIDGDKATVNVTLRLSAKGHTESRAAVILQNKDGRFVISNLLFEPRGYYYAGPITDLWKFLGAYNC